MMNRSLRCRLIWILSLSALLCGSCTARIGRSCTCILVALSSFLGGLLLYVLLAEEVLLKGMPFSLQLSLLLRTISLLNHLILARLVDIWRHLRLYHLRHNVGIHVLVLRLLSLLWRVLGLHLSWLTISREFKSTTIVLMPWRRTNKYLKAFERLGCERTASLFFHCLLDWCHKALHDLWRCCSM